MKPTKIILLIGTICISSCATALRFTADDRIMRNSCLPYIYGGSVLDMNILWASPNADSNKARFGWGAATLIDLPFSFVADTVLLPVSIPMEVAYQLSDKDKKPKGPVLK